MTVFPTLLISLFLPTFVLGRCCVPEKMSGSLDTGFSDDMYAKHVFDNAKFQIDFSAKKVMVYSMDKMPKVSNITIDFGMSMEYIRLHDGSCQAKKFPHLKGFQRCVPKDAHDWNKATRVRNPQSEWWSFSLNNVFTSLSDYRIDKSSCIPERIAVRWDTNDWPYKYYISDVLTKVDSDSDLYQDMNDCVMDDTFG